MAERDSLFTKLDAFIRKYYLNELIRGGLLSLALLVGYFTIIGLLEHFGRFSGPIRMGLFFSFLALSISCLAWFIVRPILGLYRLGNHISYEQAAQYIGRHFPKEVDDRLLNALELKKTAQTHQSELLLAAIEQRSQRLQPIPFSQAIDLKVNRKYLRFALPPLLLLSGILLFKPSLIQESTQRIVAYNQTFLPPAPFAFVLDESALKTPAHQDFTLNVRLVGTQIPENLYVQLEHGMFRMEPQGNGAFSYTFLHPSQDLPFHLSSGDHQSENFMLRVLEKPLLKKLQAKLVFPAYLGLKPELVQDQGELVVPEGTRIEWELNWSAIQLLTVLWPDSAAEYSPDKSGNIRFQKTAQQGFQYWLLPSNQHFKNTDSLAYLVSVIPDAFPEISVDAWKDTISFDRILFNGSASDDHGLTELFFAYHLGESQASPKAFKRQKIAIQKGLSQANFQFPLLLKSLNKKPEDQLWYYFEVWDNDGAGGRKFRRTPIEQHYVPSRKELLDRQEANSEAIKSGLQEQLNALEDLNQEMEKFKRDMLSKKQLGWEEKQKLKELIDQRKALEKSLEKVQDLQKENSRRNNDLSPEQQNLLDKQKKIEALFEELKDKGLDELFDELEKAMGQMDKEKLKEMMDQMEMSQEEVERELDRTLELFKQFEVEQMIRENIKQLDELAKKEDKLADNKSLNAEEKTKAQEDLNKEAEELKEALDKLAEKNEELENPRDLEDAKEEMEEIEEEMKAAGADMKSGKESEAKKKQKNAAQKMRDLAKKLESQQQESSMQAQGENMEDLRTLLENIVQLSFEQESIMTKARASHGNEAVMRSIAREQRRIINDASKVEDSLIALSKRVIELENFIMEELSKTKRGMEGSLEFFAQRQYPAAWSRQQEAMTGFNNLALMLSEAMDQMMQQMQSMGNQSGAQCNKPGMSKPDKMSDLIQRQLGLQKKLQEMEEKMKDQQKQGPQKGNKEGGEGEGEAGQGKGDQAKKLAQLAAEQEQIRREMEEMLQELGEAGRQQAAEAIKKMEENETDIVNRRITSETIKRQKDITSRMLESERALREQEEDEKRESKENINDWNIPERVLEEYLRKKEKEAEMLRTVPPALKPYYKKRVSDYFNQYP